MSAVKAIYRIPAVRTREQYAERLRERLSEPETSIFWDEERRGSVWNKWRIWNSYRDHPGVSHVCMLDDDADVVNNFKPIAETAMAQFPDAIMTFCHCNANPVRMREKPHGTPYLRLTNYDLRGISVALPVKYIDGFMSWWEEWLAKNPKTRNRDDTALKMYACVKRIPVIVTIPNLVRPLDIPSAIHPWCKSRESDLWVGYDVDAKQFEVDWYGERKSKRLFDFHLPETEPVVQYVTAEYKKQLMLR